MRTRIPVICSILIFCLLSMTGCPGPKAYVPLNQYRYIPAIPAAKFAGYKGTQVNLLNFTNYAQDTNIFHYYSPDRNIYYETSQMLSSFIWYTFRDAFNQVGIRVHENVRTAPGITDMHLIMLSMTDRQFDFRVNVTRDGITIMQKIYSVTMPAYENYDVATLEKNAYAMIDKSVVTVLSDPDFLKALKR